MPKKGIMSYCRPTGRLPSLVMFLAERIRMPHVFPRLMSVFLVCCAATLLSSPARAQEAPTAPAVPAGQTVPQTPQDAPAPQTPPNDKPQSRRFTIGPELGLFFLTNGKARNAFGSTFFNYGIGLGNIPRARGHGDWLFDATIISGSRSGGRVLLAPIGASYRIALGKGENVRPFAGVSANLIIANLRADRYNVGNGTGVTGGGSLFAGFTFGEQAYLQARYYGMGAVRGFNLSGLNLSTGFRF